MAGKEASSSLSYSSEGLVGRTASQRPRACRTGSATEAAECTETPGAPILVSQQSKPQPVRACLVASTLARSRPGEVRHSADAPAPRGNALLLCVS